MSLVDAKQEGESGPAVAAATAPATNVFGEMEFKPNFEALAKSRAPGDLRWEKVCLDIKGRTILNNISGHVGSHELMALLGPSGAGKSSMMNILAGRISSSKSKTLSGNMYVNNEPVNPIKYRRNVAYVMQEDALFATATAREALEFSARLRLPHSVTAAERKTIVDELMRSLGIEHVANTMCGSELVRGLSGGEKKRVSIGVELVTSPTLLYLDEPTSGLDSYSSWSVVTILKALSRSGCATLCTVHSPSSEIFSIFDKVMVLAQGNAIYNGSVANIADNLASVGFPIPPLTNPADFIMVIAQTKSDKGMPSFDEDRPESSHGVDGAMDVEEGNAGNGKRNAVGPSDHAPPPRESSSIMAPTGHDGTSAVLPQQSTLMTQFTELTKRETQAILRDKGALIGRFGITIFLNLLFSFIFMGAADINDSGYTLNSHFGALTNMLISALFGASQPVLLTLPLERVIFLREYSSGTYSSTPYFISKVAIEIVMYLITALVILIIQYWLVSFQADFIALLGTVWLVCIVASSYAFLAGSLVSSVKVAQEVAPLLFVPQLLFLGFFISINQIPVWLRWVQYLCALKFGLNLGMIAEFGGNRCANDGPDAAQNVMACEGLLEINDVNQDRVGLYIGILVGIFVLFRVGALFALIGRAKTFT